ncbi:ATP-binding cassette domain-containing protein [Corynebacterium sp. YIM 101645]|uniref:ATP-binding cassette domain-containing protein n=1 Tax=Corynebacterium lemuris TaxID=1859292 RepID=A0ABT2FTL1_9CORY|nr:ATP-binding cassette domain-containing protein [Corynebacterium lemuris]MCS5478542.1 ATP-binding cassette domain-containing protein [Corynebacterium lemuris]
MTSPTTRAPAIRARGVVKNFGGTRALDGLDLEVRAGSVHGLLGPNGAGKSTVVGVLATLLAPDAGTAEVAGVDVRRGRELRRHIGLVGQHSAVDEILGGRQNLVMFGRLSGLRKAAAQRRAEELLHTFDLVEAAARPVATYSGGMRRRLDIAAGLILEPDVLFLDEPTTGLDPRGRIDVWNLITGIAARGTTVLLTTQHLEEADQLADRISIMKAGRIIAEDTPAALKSQHGGDRVEITVPRDLDRLPGAFMITDEDAGVVTYPAPGGARDLIEVVRLLDAAGITPEDISLRRPTLDEVFLALTEKEEA